jgi:hypothetical protein
MLRERLIDWERSWRQSIKSPEKLLLHDWAVPVLHALRACLGANRFDIARHPHEFRSLLILRLREDLPASSSPAGYLFEILSQRYPTEVSDLQLAIHQDPCDPQHIRAPLNAVVEALDVDSGMLLRAIEAELVSPLSDDSVGRLIAATGALQYRLLSREEPSRIERSLEDALSLEGIRAAVEARPADQPMHADRASRVRDSSRRVARALAAVPDLAERLTAIRGATPSLEFREVRHIASVIEQIESPPESWDAHRLTALGREVLGTCCSYSITQSLAILGLRHPNSATAAVSYIESLEAMKGDLLEWLHTFPAVLGRTDDAYGSRAALFAWDAVRRLTTHIFREAAIDRYTQAIASDATSDLGTLLCEAVAEECRLGGVDWLRDDSQRAIVARRVSARRNVQQAILDAHVQTFPRIVDALVEAARESGEDDENGWSDGADDIWTMILSGLDRTSDAPAKAHLAVDWELVPHALPPVLRRVSEPLSSLAKFEVIASIVGVESAAADWTTAGVWWFANDRYDYGSGLTFAPASGDEKRLRARVVVDGASHSHARSAGLALIEASLSAATFVLSAGETASGLRPAIDREVVVARVDGSSSSAGWRRTREEMFDVIDVDSGAFKRSTLEMAKVIERLAIGEPTELDVRLTRAHSWYREGRWDTNPTTRFLTFFVALEQVFLSGQTRMKGTLPQVVPDLVHSWGWVAFPESEYVRPVIDKAKHVRELAASSASIASALDADLAFGNWRSDLRPLLRPSAISALAASLLASRPADHDVRSLADYAATLSAFAGSHQGYEADRQAARSGCRFTMEALMRRRNKIAHEAIISGPDAELYARSLEDILKSVLQHLHLAQAEGMKTLDEVVRWCATPWLE